MMEDAGRRREESGEMGVWRGERGTVDSFVDVFIAFEACLRSHSF